MTVSFLDSRIDTLDTKLSMQNERVKQTVNFTPFEEVRFWHMERRSTP